MSGPPPMGGQGHHQQPPYQQQYGYQGQPPPPQGQPPYGAPPQQGHYPPPQQGYYPPQGQHPPQGQYPPPQGQYPPHGQYPPQGQYPQQGQFPPQGQYPPQQQYQQPPGQYGAPPPGPPGHGYYPPQGQYQQPPQGFGGHGPPAPPSPGYNPQDVGRGDASREADALRKAMKGFGTDELTLIETLARPDPLHMALINQTFKQRHNRDLETDIVKETSGKLEKVLVALVRGPLMQDVCAVHEAVKGVGTNEKLLNDVLIGRSNADMNAIKAAFSKKYSQNLEAFVRGDLSMATEQFFNVIMAANRAEESAPINPQEMDSDLSNFYGAMTGNMGVDRMIVSRTLAQRSNNQIRALADGYRSKHKVTLKEAVSKSFSGHMRESLILMVDRAVDPAMSDAMALEDCMAGLGTKDDLLIERIVRIHWNRQHLERVKDAYMKKYGKALRSRVAGETKGDYEKALLGILQ